MRFFGFDLQIYCNRRFKLFSELRIGYLNHKACKSNPYPRSVTSTRYRKHCLRLIILDHDEFDKISIKYDKAWCGKDMGAECGLKVDTMHLLAKYSDDEKVKKETELKKAYMWFVDVFGSFYD